MILIENRSGDVVQTPTRGMAVVIRGLARGYRNGINTLRGGKSSVVCRSVAHLVAQAILVLRTSLAKARRYFSNN